ncbi:MAG: ABC transporter permease [Fimbriimonadaceae bacterium]
MSPVWKTVAAKELREMARDRRVLTGTLVGPVLIVILFVSLFSVLESSVRERKVKVALVGNAQVPDSRQGKDRLEVQSVDSREAGIKLLRDGKVSLVLEIKPDARGGADAEAVFDPAETLSEIALGATEQAFQTANRDSMVSLLDRQGIPASQAAPYRFTSTEDRRPAGLGASTVGTLLPYLIVLWAFYGIMSSVTDLFTGEKERGTLETLLASPGNRAQLAIGKLLALFMLSTVAALSTLVAVLVLGNAGLPMMKSAFPEPPHLDAVGGAMVLVALLPFAAFCSTMAAAVTAKARSVREAQTHLTLVSFLVMLPAVYSQFIGFLGDSSATWIGWTPVLGAAVSIRQALLGRPDAGMAIAATIVHLALAGVCFALVARAFQGDRLLRKP